jgi:hypothetical protein
MTNYVLTPTNAPAPTSSQTKCQLVNYGTPESPIIQCKGSSNLESRPPILPKDCKPINTGTLLKPSIQCQYPKSSSSSKITDRNDQKLILKLNEKNTIENPFFTDIMKLNTILDKYKCPSGFKPQYPNIAFTSCSNDGSIGASCNTSFQDPNLLNLPCVGKANINYSYKRNVNGAINTNQDFKCEYGKPVFNGTEINGNFTGDVMCLYELGKGEN